MVDMLLPDDAYELFFLLDRLLDMAINYLGSYVDLFIVDRPMVFKYHFHLPLKRIQYCRHTKAVRSPRGICDMMSHLHSLLE